MFQMADEALYPIRHVWTDWMDPGKQIGAVDVYMHAATREGVIMSNTLIDDSTTRTSPSLAD